MLSTILYCYCFYCAGFRGDDDIDNLLRFIGDKPTSGSNNNNQGKTTKNNVPPSTKKIVSSAVIPASTNTNSTDSDARQASPAKESAISVANKDAGSAKKQRKKKHSQHNAPNPADVAQEKAEEAEPEVTKTACDVKKALFTVEQPPAKVLTQPEPQQHQQQAEGKRNVVSTEPNTFTANVASNKKSSKPAVANDVGDIFSTKTTTTTSSSSKSGNVGPQRETVATNSTKKPVNNNNAQKNSKNSATAKKVVANNVEQVFASQGSSYIFTDFDLPKPKSVEPEFQTVASKKKKRYVPQANDAIDVTSYSRSSRFQARETPASAFDVNTPRHGANKQPFVKHSATSRSKTPPPSSAHKNHTPSFASSNMTSSASSSSSFDSGVERTPTAITSGVTASLFPSAAALDAGAFPALGSTAPRSGRRYSTGNAEFDNEAAEDQGHVSARGGESDAESSASVPVDVSSDSGRAGASGGSTAASCSSTGSSHAASLNIPLPFSYAKALRAPVTSAPALSTTAPASAGKDVPSSESHDDLALPSRHQRASEPEVVAPSTSERRYSLGSMQVADISEQASAKTPAVVECTPRKRDAGVSTASTAVVTTVKTVPPAATSQVVSKSVSTAATVASKASVENAPNTSSHTDFPSLSPAQDSNAVPPPAAPLNKTNYSAAASKSRAATASATNKTHSMSSSSKNTVAPVQNSIRKPGFSAETSSSSGVGHPRANNSGSVTADATSFKPHSIASSTPSSKSNNSSKASSTAPVGDSCNASAEHLQKLDPTSTATARPASAKANKNSTCSRSSSTNSVGSYHSAGMTSANSVVFLDKKFDIAPTNDLGISFGFGVEEIDFTVSPSASDVKAEVNDTKRLPRVPMPSDLTKIAQVLKPAVQKNGLRTDVAILQAQPNSTFAQVQDGNNCTAQASTTTSTNNKSEELSKPAAATPSAPTLRQLRNKDDVSRRQYTVPKREEDPNFMAGVFDHEAAIHMLYSGKLSNSSPSFLSSFECEMILFFS